MKILSVLKRRRQMRGRWFGINRHFVLLGERPRSLMMKKKKRRHQMMILSPPRPIRERNVDEKSSPSSSCSNLLRPSSTTTRRSRHNNIIPNYNMYGMMSTPTLRTEWNKEDEIVFWNLRKSGYYQRRRR